METKQLVQMNMTNVGLTQGQSQRSGRLMLLPRLDRIKTITSLAVNSRFYKTCFYLC